MEDLVDIVSKYDMSSNRQHRQSDLFIPLAAVRILLVAVNKQVLLELSNFSDILNRRSTDTVSVASNWLNGFTYHRSLPYNYLDLLESLVLLHHRAFAV